MVKKATVTNVQANGTWEGQYGLMYKFEVTFDNNDTGQALSKTDNCKFVVGEEATYEYKGGQYPKVKYVSEFQQNNDFRAKPKADNVQELIVKQNALTNATTFVCNNGGTPQDVLEIADMFKEWVLTNKKPASTTKTDLPF
tara:strand:+ start:18 stop:440 length:423 start_codon:yes stop_codon:yes gene_type:complete